MKKIEASLIKSLLRIHWKAFDQFNFGALISLSLSYFWTQPFLGPLLEECGILGIWSKKAKENQESVRGHHDQQLQCIFLVGIKLHV